MVDITSEMKLDNDENLDHDEHKRNIHAESEYEVNSTIINYWI